MMRILMILNVLVMLLQCQRHRREVVRSHDGLFYHQGPYLSHNRQFTRQAPAPFHRPPLLQTQPHHSTPVRFPQQHFAATGGPTQAINGHFIPHTTHQEQSFIGPAPPPQPHQPLLPPVLSPQRPAPSLTFLDNALRHQPPQELRHQPQQFRNQPQQLRHQPQHFSAPQQPLLSAPSSSIHDNNPSPPPDHKTSSALEKLMAIAGEDWDLGTSSTDPGPGPEVFMCPVSEGHFPSPRDCSVYYQCAQGQAHRRSCHTGLSYNALTNQCDWAENVKC